MAVYSRDQFNIYFEKGSDYGQSGDPLLFISGTGGDLRNKPNQFDSPLAKAVSYTHLTLQTILLV